MLSLRPSFALVAAIATLSPIAPPIFAQKPEFTISQEPDGLTVKFGDELITRYVTDSNGKPILWPILGPEKQEMTRAFPMRNDASETMKDHLHHRSLWFTYGDVNGVSFWDELEGHGVIKHRDFPEFRGGESAFISSRNDWLTPTGARLLEDSRKVSIFKVGDSLFIDFVIQLHAPDGDIRFGDTKEGAFGIRVPTWLSVDAKQGGVIVTSNGDKDENAWGKRADWVDYHGPHNGKVYGIAILNHPTSFRYPTRWHVRTYGLFAANPFGSRHFDESAEDGAHVLRRGETLALKYRVVFHPGSAADARVAELFEQYKAEAP